MQHQRTLAIAICLAMIHLAGPVEASSKQVIELTRQLAESTHYKVRLAAATSLSELADADSVPALSEALSTDPNEAVRAACASALGRFGDARVHAQLRRARERDSSQLVRERAEKALLELRRRVHAEQSANRYNLVLRTVADRSRGASRGQRKSRIKHLRRTLSSQLGSAPDEAARSYELDAAIKEFFRERSRRNVDVGCKVRVAISDHRGRIIGFVEGTARVRVPRSNYRRAALPRLRRLALEQAAVSAHRRVLRHLSEISDTTAG